MAYNNLTFKKENVEQIIYSCIVFLLLLCSVVVLTTPITTYVVQIGAVFLCLIFRLIFYHRLNLKLLLFLTAFILGIETLALYQYSYLQYTEIFWLNTHRTVFWIICAVLCYDLFLKMKINFFYKTVSLVILISSLSVFLQVISYYFFSFELDYAVLLGGESSRSIYSFKGDSMYRPTGLTSEPAIHSAMMMGLLCMQYLLNKKIDSIFILGLISILLTFSVVGILLAFLVILTVCVKNLFSIVTGGTVFLFLSLFFIDFLQERWSLFVIGEDGSNNVKIEIYNKFTNDNNLLFSGFGFIGQSKTAPAFYEAIYDMTLYFNVFIYWGVLLGLLAFMLIIKCMFASAFNWRERVFILLTFVKLSGPTLLFFNFFVVILFAVNHHRKIR